MFAIDKLNGATDSFYLTAFSVSYHFSQCIPLVTTTFSASSTTVNPLCPIVNKVSSIYGSSSPSSVPFSVPVSSVNEMIIYSCENVIAIQFLFKNGTT